MGHVIFKLATRLYLGAPNLTQEESKDYFWRALPENLKLAVAATNAETLDECRESVNSLCALIDTEEDIIHRAKSIRVIVWLH